MARGLAAPLLVAAGFALIALLAATPLVWPGTPIAAIARTVFAGLCHQQQARSFVVDGHAMAVCHRCAGIYGGLALGALAAAVVSADPSRFRPWIAGAAPLAIQVVLAWIWPALDLWWLRLATGLWAGATGGLLLVCAITRGGGAPGSRSRVAVVSGVLEQAADHAGRRAPSSDATITGAAPAKAREAAEMR